jgi:hypothetical protein
MAPEAFHANASRHPVRQRVDGRQERPSSGSQRSTRPGLPSAFDGRTLGHIPLVRSAPARSGKHSCRVDRVLLRHSKPGGRGSSDSSTSEAGCWFGTGFCFGADGLQQPATSRPVELSVARRRSGLANRPTSAAAIRPEWRRDQRPGGHTPVRGGRASAARGAGKAFLTLLIGLPP